MNEHFDIKTIENLYNEEEISGKSYLFCVDNDIDTLQDLKEYIVGLDKSVNVAGDLLMLIGTNQDLQIVEDSSNVQEIDLVKYVDLYNIAIKKCSVRTVNCLEDIKRIQRYPSINFFNFILMDRLYERIKYVKRAGQKTFEEIDEIAQFIKLNKCQALPTSTSEAGVIFVKSINLNDEHLVSSLWPVIHESKNKYSVRCKNAIELTFNEHNHSVVSLYNYFNSAECDVSQIKNVGKKTVQELNDFASIFIETVDNHIENGAENSHEHIICAKLRTVVGLNTNSVEIIRNSLTRHNRVPLFKLIDCVLKQDERDFMIISKCTRVYNGVEINVDITSSELGLTRERIRQLRNKIFADIMDSTNLWMQHFDFLYYAQYCMATCNRGNIYKDEDVDFSDDFIDVVLSELFKSDYTLIGDIQGSIMSFYDRNEALFIIPNNFVDVFNFEKLLVDIIDRVNEKVYEDYQLDINHHMLNYFVNSIRFDLIEDIMEYIRLMLYEKFQLVIEDDKVSFVKNANKTIPELVEDILEVNGNIMPLDDIYEVFSVKYPNMTKNKDTLRSNIGRSGRIVSISRSSNYALKEWEAKGIKTGTIRDLVYEFLQDFTTPQYLEDIEVYVRQHRPNTDACSIYNNISLDTRGLFELLVADDKRYIAINSHEYGDEFIHIKDTKRGVKRRTFQESIDSLYRFVLANDRLPFTSSPSDEEMRLGRFLGIARTKRLSCNLTVEEVDILNQFEEAHIDKEVSSDQYKWNLRYKELESYIILYKRLPTSKYEPALYTWLNKQKVNILKGQLKDNDTAKIHNLIELVL